MNAYGVLVMFSLGMIVLPVGGFFLSKAILFEAALGYPDGSVGAAIVAVVLIHTVIAGYVYTAWKDGPTTIQFKQD
ncbi:Vacuolar ATPase assembly integral membrane protein vma21 [Geodia barretti]|uniref:Vacuolar ATPase assembly integral membrane protein vma21 n=1 Tax=Geodia barretti TaxID=519541 RepID=A0AA35R543_GEOBA|nr:Vacuolar ATPase assembly integral membrane protein vma21 [Geodia barretti]